ncbi:MAG: hypothetical protein WBA74_05645 [Cyclobacteriaceae bacterium]
MSNTSSDKAAPIMDTIFETFLERLDKLESDPHVTLRFRRTLLEDRRFDETSLARALFVKEPE